MKKVKAIIKDKNTILLDEDANKGDYIDLSDLEDIDYSNIIEQIEKGQDKIYKEKLEDQKKNLTIKYQSDLQNQKYENDKKLIEEISKIKSNYEKDINDLKNQIAQFENTKTIELLKLEQSKNNEITSLTNSKNEEIFKLKNQINILNEEKDNVIKNANLKNEKDLAELKTQHEKDLASLNDKLHEKDEQYNLLLRQKSMLNVKQTGEDLETWCDNEVKSYMQNGFLNCKWYKDNQIIKDFEETKGSKADYIFEIYASNKHLENELLSTVVLDMKDENPDSVNKKTNAFYFNQLEKNRQKKKGTYAILVSNLENDKVNDIPIYKVLEYENMYVVRPAYLMTFLNMLVSLINRFKDLVLKDYDYNVSIKNINELTQSFTELKETYLDKPLDVLRKNIDEIKKNNENIIKASQNINELTDKIIKNYIDSINEKLNKIDHEYKKNPL